MLKSKVGLLVQSCQPICTWNLRASRTTSRPVAIPFGGPFFLDDRSPDVSANMWSVCLRVSWVLLLRRCRGFHPTISPTNRATGAWPFRDALRMHDIHRVGKKLLYILVFLRQRVSARSDSALNAQDCASSHKGLMLQTPTRLSYTPMQKPV
jgi:hypothetical protein